MKRTFLLIFLLITISWANAQDTVKSRSLNGIAESEAINLIKTYQRYIATNKFFLKQQSVWFDSSTFSQMVALLDAERKNPADRNHPTDGVRIYFGLNGDPGQGSFTFKIILVATHFYKEDPNATSGQEHEDYYLDSNLPLFGLKNIEGKIFVRGLIRHGERLYTHCTNCATSLGCSITQPHCVERDSAENWVSKFGKRPMITNSEWFSLDLLDAINQENPHDGVRIYFSKHPNGAPLLTNQVVSDKDAFIFELTQKHGIPPFKSHEDYFPPIQVKKYSSVKLEKQTVTPAGNGGNGGSGSGGQDNGELCPANCVP